MVERTRDTGIGTARPSSATRGATIYAVAELAGVSIATVSRVLRGVDTASAAATKKVLEAAEQLDYVPQNSARSLATRRYHTHAAVVGALSGPYYSELVMGYEEQAAQHGQSMLVVVADNPLRRPRELLDLRGRVDGVMIAHWTVSDEVVRELAQVMPVVTVGREIDGCDLVCSENAGSAVELTDHLLQRHGRQNMIFVGDPTMSRDARARFRGFRGAHARLGLPNRRAPLRVPYTEEGGQRAAERILKLSSLPDGIVCANDELALAVVVRLREHGVGVGQEISIVGWDDIPTARYLTPALTTVRQPVRAMGALAADLLHLRVAGEADRARTHTLPTEVVIRESCGCPC